MQPSANNTAVNKRKINDIQPTTNNIQSSNNVDTTKVERTPHNIIGQPLKSILSSNSTTIPYNGDIIINLNKSEEENRQIEEVQRVVEALINAELNRCLESTI